MSKTLKEKTIHGISWSLIDNLANQGITFIVGLVLARLLSPHEYGILGIISIFIAVFNALVDSGFSSALIRKVDTVSVDYNTVFIFNLILSVILYVILFVSAPFVSTFFNIPLLSPTLRVMGVVVIINAFAIIQRTHLIKKIDFKTQTKISVVSSTLSGGVGILMAFWGFGVWSLVSQQVSRQLINTLLLWFSNREWHPKIEFSITRFKELFNFGWKIMVVGVIGTVWEEIYQGVIGKCYSPQTLGYFTRANQFRNIFSRNLATVVQRVSYPVLSSLQEDVVVLKQSFRKILRTTFLISSVFMIMIGGVSESLIAVLIGEKWLPAAAFLQIICFSGIWNPMTRLNINMLQVQGKSGLLLKLELIVRLVALFPVLIGIFFTIEFMLWGSVVANFIIYIIEASFAGKKINYSMGEQLKDMLSALFVAIVVGVVVWIVGLIQIKPIFLLLIQLSAGCLAAVVMCELIRNKEYAVLKESVFSYVKRKIK